MIIPPINPDPILLAAQVTRVMLLNHRLAYAHLAPDLTFTLLSPNFAAVLHDPQSHLSGKPVTEVLWEFVGAEATLLAVLRGELPNYRLEQVNREQNSGETAYLVFHVTAVEENNPEKGLLLIIEDTSEIDNLYRKVAQERNELRLLYEQLQTGKTFVSHQISPEFTSI